MRLKVFFKQISGNSALLWRSLLALALFAALISWFVISGLVAGEKRQMLASLHSRAQSLAWAIEGGARMLMAEKNAPRQQMLAEIGRQPGVAWIALVDDKGWIIADSNPQLAGSRLYTPSELAKLQAERHVRGRFSPDDPDIYETWMLFQPGRFNGRMKCHVLPAKFIFIALDATDFKKDVQDYALRLALVFGLFSFAAMSVLALGFYIYNYRHSRKQLDDTKALADQIIKSYPAALLFCDDGGKIQFCNGRALSLFDLPAQPDALAAIPYVDWQAILQDLQEGAPVVDREILMMTPARSVPLSISAVRVTDGNGEPAGSLFILRDMGEINLLKEKLARSEKLSSIGKLAAGLAHELRNPLSSICGYAHYLGQKLANDSLGSATARLLEEEAQRLNNVLTELLAFARPAQLNIKEGDLAELVRKAWRLALPDAESKDIDLRLDCPDAPAPVPMDADKILQALFNLLLNAVQAVPEKGRVRISLKNVNKNNECWWLIEVRDNGPGISEKIRQQIFTPYFTTKPNGTGLGLPLAQQIAERHGGALSVESVPGQGAVFKIFLPATGAAN